MKDRSVVSPVGLPPAGTCPIITLEIDVEGGVGLSLFCLHFPGQSFGYCVWSSWLALFPVVYVWMMKYLQYLSTSRLSIPDLRSTAIYLSGVSGVSGLSAWSVLNSTYDMFLYSKFP